MICAAVAAMTVVAGGTVRFGENGLVEDPSAACAELVPWKAADAALRLVDEKVEHLGGGAYAITRTVKNVGAASVSFKDELRVRDCFAADRYPAETSGSAARVRSASSRSRIPRPGYPRA